MIVLIRNAEIFGPDPLGAGDLLVAGSRIAALGAVGPHHGSAVTTVDARGCWLLPGFVDVLTHPAGGGGEGGFANRTGAVAFEAFVEAGVTTPVGALGTDSITRSVEELYGTVMALRGRGLAALMYTGAYRVPPPTLTGDVARDLVLVEPVIGVGEVAVADQRSSQPTVEELRRLAADAQLGATLSGKGGAVLVHVGDGDDGLVLLQAALAAGNLPRRALYPTHANRNARLFAEALDLARGGSFIDFTASTTPALLEQGEIRALDALLQAIEAGVPGARLTLSSDAGGSLPHYEAGELLGLRSAGPEALLGTLRAALERGTSSFCAALAAMTRNPAEALGLRDRGRLAPGARADLLLLDPASGTLQGVMCGGQWLYRAPKLPVAGAGEGDAR